MKLVASVSPGELRVAAWDGALQDYAISRPGAPDGVDDLHRGRITARVPAMAGAFVALDGAEGFLPDSEGAASEGTILGVRITRAAQGGKGPRLSARLTPEDAALVGNGPPALLRRGPDALARLIQRYPDAPIVIDDAGTAARCGRPARVYRGRGGCPGRAARNAARRCEHERASHPRFGRHRHRPRCQLRRTPRQIRLPA
jgi:hypothetical protein